MIKRLALVLVLLLTTSPVYAATQFSHLLSAVRANGVTLAGGKVYFYTPGTFTPKTVWLDNTETTEAANPYTLDANGTVKLYGAGNYRVIVKDKKGVTQFDWDNITVMKSDLASELADGVETTALTVKSGAHFGSSFAEDIGHSNPIGRFQVYSEIAPAPDTNVGYPMGNDLALLAQGPADLRLKNIAADVTCTTSVTAGTRTVQVSATNTLADPVTLLVDPDTANEEYIVDSAWAVVDDTHLTATFTKSHTQPYTIRQVGGVNLDTRMLTINAQDPANRPMVVQDRLNNHILKLPNDTTGTFPLSAVQVGSILTGMPNLVIRNSSPTAYGEIIKSDNSGFVAVWNDTAITPVVPMNQLREQQTVLDFGATLNIQADVGGMFMVAVPNSTNFTINNPTDAKAGQYLNIMVQNVSSGAIGTITWGDKYRLSGPVAPSAAHVITVRFYFDGLKWWEVSRSAEVVTA